MDNNFINFYGRKRGRTNSDIENIVKEVLPGYVLLEDFFIKEQEGFLDYSKKYSEIHLEIGFGSGDFVFNQAQKNPNVLYLAAEVYLNGVSSLLTKLQDKPLDNIRIYHGNVYHLFRLIPDEILDYIYILFPDPWRKSRHHKRRMINKNNLNLFSKFLKKGAILRFVSDHYEYIGWTLEHLLNDKRYKWLAATTEDFSVAPLNHSVTRYEKKALDKGIKISYLDFKYLG